MPMLSHNLGPKVGPYSLGEEEEEEEPSLEALAYENGVQAVTRELTENQFGENLKCSKLRVRMISLGDRDSTAALEHPPQPMHVVLDASWTGRSRRRLVKNVGVVIRLTTWDHPSIHHALSWC